MLTCLLKKLENHLSWTLMVFGVFSLDLSRRTLPLKQEI
uniref:Uncharacterized protein n=1 Tax=Rhizophora mucronata TaxID=61149 RepID=A0A2P2QAZ2_RHIMU